MGGDDFGGGLWILVAVNSVIFLAFGASLFHPRRVASMSVRRLAAGGR